MAAPCIVALQGRLTAVTLDRFLDTRVKSLPDGRRHPAMNRLKTVPDFPIAAVH